MDSFTHIILGAVVGQATGGERLGKRALVLGALVQYLPDIDVVAAIWLDPAPNLMVHRGLTHSLFFVLVAGGALTLTARKLDRRQGFWFWGRFFGIQLLTHLFIDSFNAYGVGLFEPFHDYKYSFHALYVADPFFTVWLLASSVALLFVNKFEIRRKWAVIGLAGSALYLGYAVFNKLVVVEKVKTALVSRDLEHSKLLVTPAPLNSWLWFVAAGDGDVFHITHASVFDQSDQLQFTSVQRHSDLIANRKDPTVETLTRFSPDFYAVQMWSDTLVFTDLRFGQMKGWENPEARFVFHFYVNYPRENTLVMQRGRFAGWTMHTFTDMANRILYGPNRAGGSRK